VSEGARRMLAAAMEEWNATSMIRSKPLYGTI
jgi:hypothetical protein